MSTQKIGILLPVSALPSNYGIGGFGPEAFAWLDYLATKKMNYWQILPLHPTDPAYYYSPYSLFSSFALNPLFINVGEPLPAGTINYPAVQEAKERKLKNFFNEWKPTQRFYEFCEEQMHWLPDYALFMSLNGHYHGPWYQWPAALANREPAALERASEEHAKTMLYHMFVQFLAYTQWQEIRTYAQQLKIEIIGDTPIFVAHHSADVWVHQHLFQLDPQGAMTAVAGVPPDYFNPGGQVWGLPLYDWTAHAIDNYQWWRTRLSHALTLCDQVRLDHFRGFAGYFSIPAGALDATGGQWQPGPGKDLFKALGKLTKKLIAEDLGVITPDVDELRKAFKIPTMRVNLIEFLEFPGTNGLHSVKRHPENGVAYSTTHDFETVRGWYNNASPEAKSYFLKTINAKNETEITEKYVNYLKRSKAKTVIIQMQDMLGLDNSARMNFPGTSGPHKNWGWRLNTIPE